MLNENHDNLNWRNNLEALESLGGEAAADKNALWEKLHERLRVKRSNRKFIGYWSAAAGLLLVLMISLIDSGKKHHDHSQGETVQKQPGIKSSAATVADKETLVQITSPAVVERNRRVVVGGKHIDKYPAGTTAREMKKDRLTGIDSKAGLPEENIIPVLQPLDTSRNIADVVPRNKKLNVVHINELGDPLEESPHMARNTEIHSFQLKLANQEVYSSSSVASRAGGFSGLKSKTSPN